MSSGYPEPDEDDDWVPAARPQIWRSSPSEETGPHSESGLEPTSGEGGEDLPDPDTLFQQMTAAPPEMGEEVDPDTLFQQMTAAPPELDEEIDPETLFQQMTAGPPEMDDEVDSESLFLRMTAPEPEEIDPETLFLQMTAPEPEEIDPETLFLQMTAPEADEVDSESLFLRMTSPEPDEVEEIDPESLFLQMTAPDADEVDSDSLFLQMTALEPEEVEEIDPETLFLQMTEPSSEEVDSELLFLRMTALEEVEVEPEALPSGMLAEPPDEAEEFDPQTLFLEMTAQSLEETEESAPEEQELDSEALFMKMTTLSSEDEGQIVPEPDEPFDPVALFEEMVALEKEASPSPYSDELELPDPVELFARLHDHQELEEALPLPELEWEEETAPEVKPGLFDKIRARFGFEKKKPELILPDPAALFEQFEVEDQLEALERGERRTESAPLPELPDLDLLRAELDAEMEAELEPDLFQELSGPERFVDTISDLTFEGTNFQLPAKPEVVKPGPISSSPYQSRPERPVAPSISESPGLAAPPSAPKRPAPVGEPPSGETLKPVYRPALSTTTKSIQVASAPASQTSQAASKSLSRFWKAQTAIPRPSLAILTRQLAAMLRSGIPLHQSLSFCAESDPVAAPVLEQVVSKVESGYSLSNALREFPDSFDSVFVGLVMSGEMSGRINEMLEKLADVLERELELRKRLISVVTYPTMLIAVSILGTLGFIFFVLPQLMPLFADLGAELPWPTKVLLGLREVLLPVTAVLTLLGVGLFLARKKIKAAIAAKPILQRRLASAALNLPILGSVYEKMVVSRVLYSLSSMLEVGVTMNQALARSEESAGNAQVAFRLARARHDLTEGSTVTEAFRDNEVFPNTALQLILAGEESARTVEMFNYVARSFDDEVEYAMQAAAGYLEPMIMVTMGVVVGFITIAAAMPTIELLQNFG